MPLILSRNFIWHVYRLIAETKIFRLEYPSYAFYMLRRNRLAKSILQKDITYCFKYREFSGIFTVNYHISDNSVQINIKFTFTVYEYIIAYVVYEHILLSNFIYMVFNIYNKYIYVYTYIYIYIYISYVYIYVCVCVCVCVCVLFVYSNIIATHTQAGHNGFTFI